MLQFVFLNFESKVELGVTCMQSYNFSIFKMNKLFIGLEATLIGTGLSTVLSDSTPFTVFVP